MTTTEIRKIIAKSENAEWFNTIEVSIEYPKINFSKRFKGISSIHRFLTEQVKGWEKYGNSIPNELSNSKRHFTNLKSRIENFVDIRQNDPQSNLVSYWRNEQTQLQSYNQNSPFFTYDSPQTEFLIVTSSLKTGQFRIREYRANKCLTLNKYLLMRRSKYSESQIVFAIKQVETGTRIQEVCRKMGISEATFYNWKKKYGGLGVSELRRLKNLEEENSQLKKLVADLSLDKQILQDVLKKKF
tara:strand:+ start:498 stop:1226 length:729 start_codon:yes stop_codon:yes gene_type:complete